MGSSIATLFAQHHPATVIDVILEKVEKINRRISPIQDEYNKNYLTEKKLNLTATLDETSANKQADFVVISPKAEKQCIIGVYRLTMKLNSDNFHQSSI